MKTNTDFALGAIGQIAVTASDLARAVSYYRDTLGLKLLFDMPNLAVFDCGPVRLMLAPPDLPEFDHPASLIYFHVDDIEEAHRTLVDRGVTFEEEPELVHKTEAMELWMAFFRDMENNILAIMQERALAG